MQGNLELFIVSLQGNYWMLGCCFKQTVRLVISRPRSWRVKFKSSEFGKAWDVGGSEAKRWADVPEKAVRDWRYGKEFTRNETVGAGRGDGSFVTVRSVCFSSITARTRSANQTPPPLPSFRADHPSPSILQPPPTPALAPFSGDEDAARATLHSVHTHNYVCLRGHAHWLHQVHVPGTEATYSLESTHRKTRLSEPLLTSADKLMSSVSTQVLFPSKARENIGSKSAENALSSLPPAMNRRQNADNALLRASHT